MVRAYGGATRDCLRAALKRQMTPMVLLRLQVRAAAGAAGLGRRCPAIRRGRESPTVSTSSTNLPAAAVLLPSELPPSRLVPHCRYHLSCWGLSIRCWSSTEPRSRKRATMMQRGSAWWCGWRQRKQRR